MHRKLDTIKSRKAELKDIDLLQTLFTETVKSTCQEDYKPPQIEAWIASTKDKERWKRMVEKQFTIIAEIDQIALGFASLLDAHYIDFLYVHKDHLRKGIANHLYEILKKESLQSGNQKLISDVSITARPFFEAKGFKTIRENRKIIRGVEIINYHMSQ